jgi:uncharacterized protein YeaO (DUF488 family)
MGEAPCSAHLLDNRGEIPDSPRIRIRRVYDVEPEDNGEARTLVDGLSPRGVRKDSLHLERWAKDIAPSGALRRWFGHDPKKWSDFQYRHRIELAGRAAALRDLAELARDRTLVLPYGARGREHNQAVVLRDVLEEGIGNS